MRKNKMMRAASALLVAVLLTTSVISGTFAKYVTTAEASDTARVAKFGVVIQADGGLFNDTYLKATNTPANTGTMSVQSLPADEDLVAPGTKNDDGLRFSINGQPEVATKLDVTIESENIYLMTNKYAVPVLAPEVSVTSFEAGKYYTETSDEYTLATVYADATDYYTMQDVCDLAAPYYPVVFESEDFTTGTIASDSLDAIAAGYAQKLNDNVAVAASAPVAGKRTYTITAKEYAPNFNYASLNVAGETLKWKWEYENSGKDPADTILGHLQAGTTVVKWDSTNSKYVPTVAAAGAELNDYNLEVGFRAQFTVTQVD